MVINCYKWLCQSLNIIIYIILRSTKTFVCVFRATFEVQYMTEACRHMDTGSIFENFIVINLLLHHFREGFSQDLWAWLQESAAAAFECWHVACHRCSGLSKMGLMALRSRLFLSSKVDADWSSSPKLVPQIWSIIITCCCIKILFQEIRGINQAMKPSSKVFSTSDFITLTLSQFSSYLLNG